MSQRGYSGISLPFRHAAMDITMSPEIKKSMNTAVISVPALQALRKCTILHQCTVLYYVASIHNAQKLQSPLKYGLNSDRLIEFK